MANCYPGTVPELEYSTPSAMVEPGSVIPSLLSVAGPVGRRSLFDLSVIGTAVEYIDCASKAAESWKPRSTPTRIWVQGEDYEAVGGGRWTESSPLLVTSEGRLWMG